MPNCSVLGCNSGEKDTPQKFQMFLFPSFKDDPFQKSEKLQILWIEQLNRKDWMPTRNSRVCEKHFTIESFISAGKNVTVKGTKKSRKTLTPSAFPTLFLESYNSKSRMLTEQNKLIDTIQQQKKEIGQLRAELSNRNGPISNSREVINPNIQGGQLSDALFKF